MPGRTARASPPCLTIGTPEPSCLRPDRSGRGTAGRAGPGRSPGRSVEELLEQRALLLLVVVRVAVAVPVVVVPVLGAVVLVVLVPVLLVAVLAVAVLPVAPVV